MTKPKRHEPARYAVVYRCGHSRLIFGPYTDRDEAKSAAKALTRPVAPVCRAWLVPMFSPSSVQQWAEPGARVDMLSVRDQIDALLAKFRRWIE